LDDRGWSQNQLGEPYPPLISVLDLEVIALFTNTPR
jgi:hypothetical protein